MSLDVSLRIEAEVTAEPKIYVRRNGSNVCITREEWDALYPDREPYTIEGASDTVFDYNITHNLSAMADAAGLYKYLWRPEENGISEAWQLVEPLTAGLELLRAKPQDFRAFNPKNGWGNYEGLVQFVTEYLEACKKYPKAAVYASR